MVQFLPVCMCVRVHRSADMCTCWVHNSSVKTQKRCIVIQLKKKKKVHFQSLHLGNTRFWPNSNCICVNYANVACVASERKMDVFERFIKSLLLCFGGGRVCSIWNIQGALHVANRTVWLWHNKYLWVPGGASRRAGGWIRCVQAAIQKFLL